MRDIIRSYPRYIAEVTDETLESISDLIVFHHHTVTSALSMVGIDSRYYRHWVQAAQGGDERAYAIVTFLNHCEEIRDSAIRKSVADGRDSKAKVALLELYRAMKADQPAIDDNNILTIADDWV